MVCTVETSQLMLMLPHRSLLQVEKTLENALHRTCLLGGACAVGGSNACLLAHELVSIEEYFGSADNGGRGG